MRFKQQRTQHSHYCLLVNRKAANYDPRAIEQLVEAIKHKKGAYSILEPISAVELMEMAEVAVGVTKRDPRANALQIRTRGKVTCLVACGGDGTFNLTARAAVADGTPVSVLPLGRDNNIARSLLKNIDIGYAISRILERKYRLIDIGQIADQLFFGSAGIGFVPHLHRTLGDQERPAMAYRWAKVAGEAAEKLRSKRMIIRIDAFRFEVKTRMAQVNLLSHSTGLQLSPASVASDGQAEVIVDFGAENKELAEYTRQLYKKKYLYGALFRLFRGTTISIQPIQNRSLYLDGEIIRTPSNAIEMKVLPEKLKVFC
jgi:diacylglycerol kinase family enzyme